MATTVSEIKKEIYDDEVYTRAAEKTRKSDEIREIEQALEATPTEDLTLEGTPFSHLKVQN